MVLTHLEHDSLLHPLGHDVTFTVPSITQFTFKFKPDRTVGFPHKFSTLEQLFESEHDFTLANVFG